MCEQCKKRMWQKKKVQFKTSLYKIIQFPVFIPACVNVEMQMLKRSKIFGKSVRQMGITKSISSGCRATNSAVESMWSCQNISESFQWTCSYTAELQSHSELAKPWDCDWMLDKASGWPAQDPSRGCTVPYIVEYHTCCYAGIFLELLCSQSLLESFHWT